MKRFRIAVAIMIAVASITFPAWAQSPPQSSKDRKDFIIEVLEGQRNSAQSGLAGCLGAHNDISTQMQKQLVDLNTEYEKAKKQIAEITAENDKLKKPADAPPAAAADPTPK